MEISKKQFDVVNSIYEYGKIDVDVLSERLFLSVEEVLKILEELRKKDLLTKDGISEKGLAYLKNHEIDNAIILAAGLSSRFVPLNYELPKGLLMVKGEPLIERQINQLHEKGIQEIIVVVGYMKEKFEYLKEKFNVILIEAPNYNSRNNHDSLYAAKEYLKKSIITSSDLYFSDNIFQKYAYDSYYCTIFKNGKTAERGVTLDKDDKIIKTFYGDRCYDVWVTLGYAFFSSNFSKKMINILGKEYELPETSSKFWADIQDEHLDELSMYAKKCHDNVIYEFDSLEELREFDDLYLHNSNSSIMKQICNLLAVKENNIIGIESMRDLKPSMFRFRCKGDSYICDVDPDNNEKIHYLGHSYYQCRDLQEGNIKLFKMDKNIRVGGRCRVNLDRELDLLYSYVKDFGEYHKRALPLCAAENVISPFANLPLTYGFQERYIMNNTYSFNMDDNFIGCEKLLPFYQMLSETCERIFGARYTDARPFTGMHCIDMIVKTVCKPKDKIIILDKEDGGHASVKPVVERLGLEVISAPYDIEQNDLDYEKVNKLINEQKIKYILLAPSDLIKPLNIQNIDTTNCVLLWDCSQLMGLIAAGLCENPLRTKRNVIMFGGTHKTFPGPASGLILTNEKYLHDRMETVINPTLLRHSQMHQKISLLFALLEFEQYGADYMSHMVHCSNYLGERLRDAGYDVADINGQISQTHQIFIRCSKEEMDTIYDNAYKCEVTLNKKHKDLFSGYGIRLGTQEIARYDWNDAALDIVADIVYMLSIKGVDVNDVKKKIAMLPNKTIHYAFSDQDIQRFRELMLNN